MAEVDLNDLYTQIIEGDGETEAILFEALTARFSMFARRRVRNKEDAEEVVQNALMAISSEYLKIDIKDSFSAWAYKVLDNRIKAYWKTQSRSRRRLVSTSDSDRVELTSFVEFDPNLKRVLLGCLEKIGRANLRYARILNLKHQGYGTEEICDRLDVKPANLFSIVNRARALLKRCLEKGDLL
jgi:RNA polymerase sigma factor (sigma-70 family)